MKKFVSVALATLALGGAVIAGPASAEPRSGWHGGGYHEGWHGGRGAGIVGAGLLGLAVGAAIATPHYAPAPAYYGCTSHWAWDRYAGRYVRVSDCY